VLWATVEAALDAEATSVDCDTVVGIVDGCGCEALEEVAPADDGVLAADELTEAALETTGEEDCCVCAWEEVGLGVDDRELVTASAWALDDAFDCTVAGFVEAALETVVVEVARRYPTEPTVEAASIEVVEYGPQMVYEQAVYGNVND